MTYPSCRVCGRPLRSKKWAARRIGPVCERRTRAHTAPRTRTPAPAATPETHPGQIELPLPPMQHELTWRTS